MTATRKKLPSSDSEVADLLKKMLVLQMYQLGLPQTIIGKRLKLRTKEVNDLLKGIKKKS